MLCPRCEAHTMIERERDGVVIDVCDRCRGVWLDRGELEKLIARAQREVEAYDEPYREPPRRDDRHDDRRDDRHDDRRDDRSYKRKKKKSGFMDMFDIFD